MAETLHESQVTGDDVGGNAAVANQIAGTTGNQPSENLNLPQNNFPPPKTDKPRPHGCTTCGRSFARLEHLKRHERSHTKEKPFECPECTRCFARRDLLLRHQQKLHMTTTPAARPRAGRRESTSSNAQGGSKVRKNSTTQSGGSGSMRPRANTISHADVNATGFIAAANANVSAAPRKRPGHSTHPSLCGLPTLSNFEYRGMSALPRNRPQSGLPKIETQGLPMDLSGNLRTAPAFPRYAPGFGHDQMFSPGNTINPAQLHFLDSPNPLPFDTPISPFHPSFNFMSSPGLEDDGTFDWINGFDTSMSFGEGNENAIAESSPSAMSTGSPAPENAPEVFNMQNSVQSTGAWQPSALSQAPMLADYSMDMSSYHSGDMKNSLSPKNLNLGFEEHHFQPHHPLGLQSPQFHSDPTPANGLHIPFMNSADTPTTTTASIGSSNRHSSVTSVCTDAITDATRAALLATLSQSGPQHHRKFSNPVNVAPKLGDGHARSRSVGNVSLPSTYDLQRYIGAYIQYFHPHLPFLHIPTLSFNSPAYANNLRSVDDLPTYASGISGGGGCLILAMAAIGALYEFENAASKELFDLAKKMIQAYLEERRKADISTAMNGRNDSVDDAAQNTPLWLVQSMMLNVIYGLNSGDKMSADIASTHCAALVSLARAADLAKPARTDLESSMHDSMEGGWHSQPSGDASWHKWKVGEERKRTLYAVYILSSMLVSAYNHSPALTNSEILLDLPCEEDIWAAESYEAWLALGGQQGISARSVTFADALGWLLGASQRQPHSHYSTIRLHHPLHSSAFNPEMPPAEIPISTFGCLVLIHSLHNYIWETRQRHLGREWTTAETEAMHGHIEPALVAWHTAWASHPHHSLERPNPYGMGPLSADSIPLLDLAYVRLFVNLGRSKEAFWHRDWEQMAYEIARGAEIVQHAESGTQTPGFSNNDHFGGAQTHQSRSPDTQIGQSTRREKHMRKAAFHAAHSLCTSDKLGVSFADFNSRELPIASAMCAFDCAQVLAEWVTTVQERVGRYVGILGGTHIDFEAVPAIMLLDQEDVKLFSKIDELLSSMELKQAMDSHNSNQNSMNINPGSIKSNRIKPQVSAYGSKILMGTLHMLEGSAVWPIIRVMARSLESQAAFMEERAMKSTHPEEQEQHHLPQQQTSS